MLAATYTQGGEFAVHDVPEPAISADEILLRVTASAICGTDIKITRHGHRKLRDGQRIILGHEFVGEIAEVGSGVSGYDVGQRIGVAPDAGCGTCEACLRGQTNYCPDYTAFGIDMDGAHAPLVRIPAKFIAQGNLVPLPDGIPDRAAALLEPLSCVLSGVRVSRIEMGDTVVIYGAGPIGLMHVMLCCISGAARIIVVDPAAERLPAALKLGADLTVDPSEQSVADVVRDETNGYGANVVITACPAAAAQEEGVSLLAPFGRLCLFGGLPNGAEGIRFDSNAVHYRNLLVTGSTGGSVADYRAAVRLVAAGRIDIKRVISSDFRLDEVEEAYSCAANGPDGKVVLVP